MSTSDAPEADEGEAEAEHLRGNVDALVDRLAVLAQGVGDAAASGTPGAYVLPAEVAARRSRRPPESRPPLATAARCGRLAAAFELSRLELDLVLIAAAPDLDDRVALLVGYVHDDLTRRRPSCGLALRLCGVSLDEQQAHRALSADGHLVASGLLVVEDPSAPLPDRALRCPDRVVAWLLGVDEAGPPVARLLASPPPMTGEAALRLGEAVRSGVVLHFLHAPPGTDPAGLAVSAADTVGASCLVVDLNRLRRGDDPDEVTSACLREARLRGAVLVAGPVERLVDAGGGIEAWADSGWPSLLYGARNWDPTWARRPPRIVTAPPVDGHAQLEMWRRALGDPTLTDDDLADATVAFRLTGEQVTAAAAAAQGDAVAESRAVGADDVRRSARGRNTGGLDRFARRVQPEATFDDLILPSDTLEKLHELVDRSRHRDIVYREWAMSGSAHRGDGLTALFAGPSGTGKTMAAEVVAHALGLDLYLLDMSSVVDKFIGETEKNLERVFDEAERVNGVLMFDEADALFGKRSEVKDAHDRYANLETAYLLQRIEGFSGVAILTTNLRSNLDDAFARRLDAIVNFPIPDEEQRLRLWSRFLGSKVPVSTEVDLDFCAARFELTGANIRNIALAAAFFAAEAGPPVEMEDVIRAVEREYEKLGRLRSKAEFGEYAGLLSEQARGR